MAGLGRFCRPFLRQQRHPQQDEPVGQVRGNRTVITIRRLKNVPVPVAWLVFD